MPRPLTLALDLDRAADTSLSSQVAGQIRDRVLAGMLPVAGRLPSTRALARDLAAEGGVRPPIETQREREWSWHKVSCPNW